ncbi:hypothetical protein LY78DRAFT_256494 [Colletotrichum sublineola]|nr:hypothetical protein LY78DRAFT_256494 [Colletotrichum sublineola]
MYPPHPTYPIPSLATLLFTLFLFPAHPSREFRAVHYWPGRFEKAWMIVVHPNFFFLLFSDQLSVLFPLIDLTSSTVPRSDAKHHLHRSAAVPEVP